MTLPKKGPLLHTHIDPIVVIECYNKHKSELVSWRSMSTLLKRHYRVIRNSMRRCWRDHAMERQFEANRRRRRKEIKIELLMYLSLLGEILERTPTEYDIKDFCEVTHAAYVHHFGSFCRAQALAGFTPNQVGERGHRTKTIPPIKTVPTIEIPSPIDRIGRLRRDAHGFRHLHANAA